MAQGRPSGRELLGWLLALVVIGWFVATYARCSLPFYAVPGCTIAGGAAFSAARAAAGATQGP